MSEAVVAETRVRIRADATDFQREAEQQVNAAVANVQAQVKITGEGASAAQASDQILGRAKATQKEIADQAARDIDAQVARVQDLFAKASTEAFKATTARIGGDEAQAAAREFQADVLTFQATAAQFELAQKSAIAQAAQSVGAEREQLLAAAEAFGAARQELDRRISRAEQTGTFDPQRGALGRVRDFIRAGGTDGGIGQLLGAGARLGAVGFAATAAFQAVGHLGQALRVTGDEAFTAGGKFRNAAADILSADFIGAFQSLTRERPAEIAADLTAKLKEQRDAVDPLVVTEQKLLAARQDGREELSRYLAVLVGLGGVSIDQALRLAKLTEELYNQERAARAAAEAVDGVRTAIERAGSEAAAFGERGTPFGRGPGGVAAERPRPGAIAPAFDETATADTSAAVRRSIAQRTAGLADDLSEARREVERIRERNENLRQVTEGRAQRYRELVEAQTRALTLEKQLAASQREQDDAILAAQNTINESLADRTKGLDDNLAAARKNAAAIAQRNAQVKGTAAEEKQQQAELVQAQTAVTVIEQQIAEQRKQEAEQAAENAKSAREASLANAEARAELTKGNADNIRAIQATIAYFRELKKQTSGVERERADAALIAARGRLAQVRSGPDSTQLRQIQLENRLAVAEMDGVDTRPILEAQLRLLKKVRDQATGIERAQAQAAVIAKEGEIQGANETLAELRRQNARARAELTKTKADDIRLAEAEIDRLKALVKSTQGIEKERNRAKLIAERGRLAALRESDASSGGQGPSTLDIAGLNRQIFSQFAGNIQPLGTAARARENVAAVFGRADTGRDLTDALRQTESESPSLEELRAIRRILERQSGRPPAQVDVHQTFQKPDADGFAQARAARFAMEQAFNG